MSTIIERHYYDELTVGAVDEGGDEGMGAVWPLIR